MNVGTKIRQVRLHRKQTQQQLCRSAGMAVAYLSRLENDRINPSVNTLQKLAAALEVPVASFFDPAPVLEVGDRCPVSLDGVCILDQAFRTRGRPPGGTESYTREHLELLRLFNFLLHSAKREVRVTLATLLRSLAESSGAGGPGKTEP